MSEWIKFDFDLLSETTACDLVMYFDGVQVDSQRISWAPTDDHTPKKATMWHEISDDIANGVGEHSGGHNIRINVVERLAENGDPIYEYPMIEMVGVELSGSQHIPAEGNINSSIKVYNVLDAVYQTLIDSGEAKHDSQVTEDLGNGPTTYSVSSWDDYKVMGNGAWVLEFSCPYLTWYDAVHAD
tara:strand:+ start:1807 stop:2361 length:555 start_codon:yes stop_codon:yes gene_type:complete